MNGFISAHISLARFALYKYVIDKTGAAHKRTQGSDHTDRGRDSEKSAAVHDMMS